MNWTDLKSKIYYKDGSLRDIYILGTDRADWGKWVGHVNQKYTIKWFNPKTQKTDEKVDFEVIEEYWNGNGNFFSTAHVFLGKTQVNAHFFQEDEIENDIAPTEFKTIEDHEKLMDYMAGLSLLLDKEVILTPENMREIVLVKVSKDGVFINEEIESGGFITVVGGWGRATLLLENFKVIFKNFKAKLGK